MFLMCSYVPIPYLRLGTFFYGFFCRILPWKMATKFNTEDSDYETISWRKAVEYKPGCT